jgi:tetratricopeptide (TPR) repeat protein
VDLYIKIGKFKEAEKIAEQLIKNHPTKDILLKYLYIKFQNTNFFDQKQVNTLKSIVSWFYKEWILSLDDLTFYNFLIDLLSNWDTSKLEIVLNSLIKDIKNPVYKNILYSFKKDLEVYKNNPGAPLYYFKALVALDLLKYWYFWIAKNIAESVYIEDSDYVLPKQILAYSYFYMGNYKQALKYFHELKDDVDNDNEYNFFIWISYYWLGDYRNALLYLAEVKKDFSYYLDVLRYEFLIYKKIKDTDKIIDVISSMLKYKLSYVDYYNIFKYLLFDCSNCYKENLKLLVNLLKKCYKDTDSSTEYVCWYGKANLFYKSWKEKYAIKYFELLTKYFQDSYIYDILGKYYENKKNIKKARYYYLKELLYTIDEHKREQVKEKIKKLYLKNRD